MSGDNDGWNRPAIMTYMKGNHAVRNSRWRYIRYADGTEELYDHSNDINEWNNVASNYKNDKVIKSLRKWLPVEEKQQISNLRK